MKLSIKSDYAARAVFWLAQHYAEGAARTVDEMASEQGIPPNYLVQILIELKSAQIVKSQRGKDGGRLVMSPVQQRSSIRPPWAIRPRRRSCARLGSNCATPSIKRLIPSPFSK